jgi:hypothetical protein
VKRFQTYLNERSVAWSAPVADRIFSKTLNLPISSTIYKRVFDGRPDRDTVFHVMAVDAIDDLAKLQGKSKSISAFTEMTYNVMRNGVNAGGGVIAEMEADILIEFPNDVMSRPDSNGRRWIPISNLTTPTYEKLRRDISKLMKELMSKHFDAQFIYGNDVIDILRAWEEVPARLMRYYVTIGEPQKRGKAKAAIIKDFIDGSEKLMKKHAKLIKAELVQSNIKKKETDMWNELVVNKIDIKKLHIERGPKFYMTFLNQYFPNEKSWISELETNPEVTIAINKKMMELAKKYRFQYFYHDTMSDFTGAVKSKRAQRFSKIVDEEKTAG